MTDVPEVAVQVTVVADDGADDDETAELRSHLRSLLVEHEFDVSDPPAAVDVPSGAKVGDPASINSVVVALAASGGALTALVSALQAWLLRSSARQVVVEIDGDRLEVNGVSSEERRQITAVWLARHQPRAEQPSAQPGHPDAG